MERLDRGVERLSGIRKFAWLFHLEVCGICIRKDLEVVVVLLRLRQNAGSSV